MNTCTHVRSIACYFCNLSRGTYLRILDVLRLQGISFSPLFSRTHSHEHTYARKRTQAYITHANVPRSRLNIFITIFCDQKINSIMYYPLIKLRLSIDHGYVLHLRRFRRLRIHIDTDNILREFLGSLAWCDGSRRILYISCLFHLFVF